MPAGRPVPPGRSPRQIRAGGLASTAPPDSFRGLAQADPMRRPRLARLAPPDPCHLTRATGADSRQEGSCRRTRFGGLAPTVPPGSFRRTRASPSRFVRVAELGSTDPRKPARSARIGPAGSRQQARVVGHASAGPCRRTRSGGLVAPAVRPVPGRFVPGSASSRRKLAPLGSCRGELAAAVPSGSCRRTRASRPVGLVSDGPLTTLAPTDPCHRPGSCRWGRCCAPACPLR